VADGNYIFTDGSKFNNYHKFTSGLQILAANASLWVPRTFEKNLRGEGLLLQIDHLNVTTGVKFSRVMQCERMPQNKREEDENCTLIAKASNVLTFQLYQLHNMHLFVIINSFETLFNCLKMRDFFEDF
jgi:hypothetical protein